MTKRWRRRTVCALIALGSASASLLLSKVRFFQLLNYKAADVHFVVKGAEAVPNVVLITADQKAFDRFQELQMFWHRYYAEAIRIAGEGGAKVIGLDHAFGVPVERWEPGLDGLLAGAVGSSPVPVVCGYVPELNTNRASHLVPVNIVAAGLGLAGYTNLTSDSDDFVRRQELFESGPTPERSLALRVVEKYLGKDAVIENGRMLVDGQPVPVGEDRSLWINFAGPPGTFNRVSLADVMDHTNDLAWAKARFDGKIVLIGVDSFTDRYATPFYTMFSGPKWTTAGVEIHASTVRTLLDRQFLQPAPPWLRAANVLAAAGVTVAVAVSVSATAAVASLVGICAGIFAVTHLLFRAGHLTSTSEAILAALLAAIAAVIYRFATEQVRGNLFRKAVSLFVSKDLAKSLEETQTIGLSGRRVTVTILFTDIRGFTAFTEKVCEEQGPEVVVDLLNKYMESMVAIIVKYRGHVNKFIGDGILAVFSDDDEGTEPGDHAHRGVQCAIEMVTAPSNFKTGAGLHTGLVVVGNVGSADKMEYTVLGDTVNLASRLESLNKEHKTSLLMSESTYSALEGKVPAVLLGSVPVRGKAAEVNLYTVSNAK